MQTSGACKQQRPNQRANAICFESVCQLIREYCLLMRALYIRIGVIRQNWHNIYLNPGAGNLVRARLVHIILQISRI